MSARVRLNCPVTLSSWLYDHRIADRAVLPATVALGILADQASSYCGALFSDSVEAFFRSFLYLPDRPTPTLETVVELDPSPDGSCNTSLMTRITARHGAVSRMKTHLSVRFLPANPQQGPPAPAQNDLGRRDHVPAQAVYQDLVPFGPAFRNCTGRVNLEPGSASAKIEAPRLDVDSDRTGSPFVLDAALHVANVWTQKFRQMVAFPVGYESRHIPKVTRQGETYLCQAVPGRGERQLQLFDLWILDSEFRVCEAVVGVQMRELFPGVLQPPHWLSE